MTDSYTFNQPRGNGLRDDTPRSFSSSNSEVSDNGTVDNTKKETSSNNNQKGVKKKTRVWE